MVFVIPSCEGCCTFIRVGDPLRGRNALAMAFGGCLRNDRESIFTKVTRVEVYLPTFKAVSSISPNMASTNRTHMTTPAPCVTTERVFGYPVVRSLHVRSRIFGRMVLGID